MLKRFARLFGYELIRKTKMPTLEAHLLKVLNCYKPDVVIDVGANIGQFGMMLRSLGYKGRIVSFEPVEATFQSLKKTASHDDLWDVYNFGLGHHKHKAEINVFEKTVFSSILDPSEFGKSRYAHMNSPIKQEINIDTLDNFIDENGLLENRIFLKMDTQGFDLQVFRGSGKTLNNVVALMSEISFEHIYDGMPGYHQSLVEYEKAGFSMTGLFPITRRADGGLIEMDCVLINKKFSVSDFPR